MRLIHSRAFAAAYWVVAFLVAVAGLIFGAHVGLNNAPEFSDGSGVSAGSQLLSAVLGGVLGVAVVAALFAAGWISMWAVDRRVNPVVEADAYDDFEDFSDEGDEHEEYTDSDFADGASHEDGVSSRDVGGRSIAANR